MAASKEAPRRSKIAYYKQKNDPAKINIPSYYYKKACQALIFSNLSDVRVRFHKFLAHTSLFHIL